MKYIFSTFGLLFFLLAIGQESELTWPREIEKDGFVTTLYQPQLESFKSNVLEGRMALSVKPKDKDLVFGAIWFKARLATDKDTRIAVLENLEIPKIHFPEVEDEEIIKNFATKLIEEVESWNVEMSLDRIIAGLKEVEDLAEISDQLNNDPPAVIYRNTPASLISIDGEPVFKDDKNNGVKYVQNTPFFLVAELGDDDFYMQGGKFWYTSKSVLSGWEETNKVPKKVKQFAKNMSTDEGQPDSVSSSITEAPEIIVVTEPTELIVTDGEPDYAAIEGTSLLYVKNSESDIIMDINSQQHYVLISGRWYHAKKLDGDQWAFEDPKNLPADFAKIPESSDIGNVRISVPGTPEADDALLEQSIPQTATVNKKDVSLEVTYDGEPQFESIDGTNMSYAKNTSSSVLKIDNLYYAVDDGIWFSSKSAKGPWTVSDSRPNEVDQLPPDCPVYNVKYVYIYESTPEVVYVGYLPGYNYSYVYGGVVVYGTGYYYQPWYGTVYYPRPVTYGWGVHYNPYTGWGFHAGFSYGWVSWGFHPYGHSYWGPRGYYPGYRHGYNHGYHNGYRNGYAAGYRHGQNQNMYNGRKGVNSNISNKNPANRKPSQSTRPSSKPNNMYSDRSGNVYKGDNKGNFQQQQNRSSPSNSNRPSNTDRSKPSNTDRSTPSNTQQLNRSQQSRQRGSSNYQSTPQRSGGFQGGGGTRGGGGRRR